MRLTLAETILNRCVNHPDRIAIEVLQGGPSLTYGQVRDRIEALADAMAGSAPGRHGRMVGILLPNAADHVLAYMACQWAGAGAVPVNSRMAPPEMQFVIKDSDAKLILAAGPWLDAARTIAAATGATVIDADSIATPPRTGPLVLGESERGAEHAVVGYTSGTTGFPKGALYSNDHYLTSCMRWGWEFGLTARDVMLVPGPLFHLSYAGLSFAALAIGARIRIMQTFEAPLAMAELAEHCSFAFLVPSMTTMIAEEWRRQDCPPISAFRFMISSGAPGPLSLTKQCLDMFPNAEIAEAYGWTEGGWVTFEVKRRDTLLAHSVGWPTFGNEVAVFDEAGNPCPVGEPGEVGVKALTHFSGYLGRDDATAAAWHRPAGHDRGYVMSGDVGIWQPDGRLCIVDRKKDMIISGGENIYTAEVERILHEHPDIIEAAVVGLPDERWGELVTAMIVSRDPALDPGAVEAFCRERLAGYKVPRRVIIADELPRNPMGKVQKFRIIEALTGD